MGNDGFIFWGERKIRMGAQKCKCSRFFVSLIMFPLVYLVPFNHVKHVSGFVISSQVLERSHVKSGEIG